MSKSHSRKRSAGLRLSEPRVTTQKQNYEQERERVYTRGPMYIAEQPYSGKRGAPVHAPTQGYIRDREHVQKQPYMREHDHVVEDEKGDTNPCAYLDDIIGDWIDPEPYVDSFGVVGRMKPGSRWQQVAR
ncbi:MAG: hypothetical protein M1820_009884 [Bogoriella megaspora]|nr:MAG: hypothetical protein M1820_009884 [Bogoriella megaspora]